MHPRADDYWDGNWLISPIEVAVGGFRGRVGAGLRVEELIHFRKGLAELYVSLDGEAVLESLETWITLRVSARPTGQLTVTGTVTDEPGIGNELTFEIADLDQTDIPAIVQSLSEIEAAFPLVGSAADG
jgi:hypothetical protein